MARKYEVTNLAKGPRGFHTVDRGEVIIGRHETEVITVEGGVEKLLLAMVESREVEANDLGAAGATDHDKDGKKGGAKAPLPAPGDDAAAKLKAERDRADAAEARANDLEAEKGRLEGQVEALRAEVSRLTTEATGAPAAPAAPGETEPGTGGTDGAAGPAADAATIENAAPAEYAPSLDFESLDEEQLRGFLKAAEVTFHPQTGKPKLVEKALAADRAQWDEAQAALKPAPAPDAAAEQQEAV